MLKREGEKEDERRKDHKTVLFRNVEKSARKRKSKEL